MVPLMLRAGRLGTGIVDENPIVWREALILGIGSVETRAGETIFVGVRQFEFSAAIVERLRFLTGLIKCRCYLSGRQRAANLQPSASLEKPWS